MELAQWWATFQEVDDVEKNNMVAQLAATIPGRPKKRRKRKVAK